MADGQQIIEIADLETPCQQCTGKGSLGEDVVIKCWCCEGTGYILTDTGESLTSFLFRTEQRKNYRKLKMKGNNILDTQGCLV